MKTTGAAVPVVPTFITDADVEAVVYRLTCSRAGAAVINQLLTEIALTGDMDADMNRAVRQHIARAARMEVR